jgi:hypothetical protein
MVGGRAGGVCCRTTSSMSASECLPCDSLIHGTRTSIGTRTWSILTEFIYVTPVLVKKYYAHLVLEVTILAPCMCEDASESCAQFLDQRIMCITKLHVAAHRCHVHPDPSPACRHPVQPRHERSTYGCG